MGSRKHIGDFREIIDIMNRTTQFISLRGLSGISTGITVLAGAFIAFKTVFKEPDYLAYEPVELIRDSLNYCY